MILDAYGRAPIRFHPLAFSTVMEPLRGFDAERRVWELHDNVRRINPDFGTQRPRVGDTIHVRLPKRYR